MRHNGYWNSSKYGWTNLNTYLRHDYSFGQGGQLTFGQSSTDDGVFESFPFEGISIGSDDGMLVPWMSTYSPTIRGIAFTPSQIIVKQNNMIIWQGDVPAGPFELQDVFPLYGGIWISKYEKVMARLDTLHSHHQHYRFSNVKVACVITQQLVSIEISIAHSKTSPYSYNIQRHGV
ncbi:fimbria/pilus outer membrane usher protein [Escherichia coli]|nr:fimbria/pilus outer membrane usher protein [Escherichia coli]